MKSKLNKRKEYKILLESPQRIKEELALSWMRKLFLRSFKVIEKPDEIRHDIKLPDFVLKSIKTNKMYIIEIKWLPVCPYQPKLEKIENEALIEIPPEDLFNNNYKLKEIIKKYKAKEIVDEIKREVKNYYGFEIDDFEALSMRYYDADFIITKLEKYFKDSEEKFKNYLSLRKLNKNKDIICALIIVTDDPTLEYDLFMLGINLKEFKEYYKLIDKLYIYCEPPINLMYRVA